MFLLPETSAPTEPAPPTDPRPGSHPPNGSDTKAFRRRWLVLGIGAGLALLVVVIVLLLFRPRDGKTSQPTGTAEAGLVIASEPVEPPPVTPTPMEIAAPMPVPATSTPLPSPSPTLAPDVTPAATVTPLPIPYLAVSTNRLNVYAAPGVNYKVLGEVRRGDQLPVLGRLEDGTWWQVNYFGLQGWIPAQPAGINVESTILTVVSPPTLPTTTPTPTHTPSPTVTPTREPVRAYRTVSIAGVANATLDFSSPPTGDVTLGGVLFHLSEWVFKSQASPSPHNTFPTSAWVAADVSQAYRMHLLLNTGNGFNQFSGMVIGQVWAYCDDTPIFVTDLQLGRDVREWHVADNVVSTASRARQVWSGPITGFPDLNGDIDMLSLDLPNACRSGKLTAIEIIDTSASAVNSLDPALSLIGITVEYYQ